MSEMIRAAAELAPAYSFPGTIRSICWMRGLYRAPQSCGLYAQVFPVHARNVSRSVSTLGCSDLSRQGLPHGTRKLLDRLTRIALS